MSLTNVYFLLFAGKPKKQLLSNAANHSATWKVIILRLWYSKKDCSDVSRWSDNLGRLLMHLMFSVMLSALKVIFVKSGTQCFQAGTEYCRFISRITWVILGIGVTLFFLSHRYSVLIMKLLGLKIDGYKSTMVPYKMPVTDTFCPIKACRNSILLDRQRNCLLDRSNQDCWLDLNFVHWFYDNVH